MNTFCDPVGSDGTTMLIVAFGRYGARRADSIVTMRESFQFVISVAEQNMPATTSLR